MTTSLIWIQKEQVNNMETKNILKRAGGIFENQGVEYTLETIAGAPGYTLARLAKSKTYDLIIMGSHGHSDIAGHVP